MRIFFLIAFVLFIKSAFSQDIEYVRSLINKLASEEFHGRGYTFNGLKIASDFVAGELEKDGIKPVGNSYFQKFEQSVNTFPKNVSVTIDDKKLIPGTDYLVSPESGSCKGKYNVVVFNKSSIESKQALKDFLKQDYSKSFVLVDSSGVTDVDSKKIFTEIYHTNPFKAKGIIELNPGKLSWHVSDEAVNYIHIVLRKAIFSEYPKTIDVDIKNKFIKKYSTQNIVAFIPGETDTFIVFSAHYDHLGTMGNEAYFPGANDNAGGTAMVLNLAKYYSQQKEKPHYGYAFLFFSSEEAGLVGSSYYAINPLFPLSEIKILINLDLVGTGDDGIMIVNGAVFKDVLENFRKINDEKQYVKQIKVRGEAANSDHYPFYAKGVKSIFIYTLGGISEYHNLLDKAETLPLTEYEDLFRLITDFVKSYE